MGEGGWGSATNGMMVKFGGLLNPMPANALDYITIKGFRSISSVEKLALRPINVLVGANGSGKSNFIGVFAFLHEIREGRLQHYVTAAGGAEKLLHFGSKTTKEMSFHLSFADQVNEYELRLLPTEDDGLFPWDPAAPNRSLADFWQQAAALPPPVRDWLGGWRVYHVHDTSSSSPMRKTAKVDD